MTPMEIVKWHLEKYENESRYVTLSKCIKERLKQVLTNYNDDLEKHLKTTENNIEEYWKRKERKKDYDILGKN